MWLLTDILMFVLIFRNWPLPPWKKNSVSLKLYLAVHSRPCLRVSLQQSSVCGAGLHSGVIDNDGGWLDVTRLGRKQQFTKSYKNGIQSIGYESDSVFGFRFFCYQKVFNTESAIGQVCVHMSLILVLSCLKFSGK